MRKKPGGIVSCRRGLTEIITAIFMLLLMIAAITAILAIYSNMNSNSQDMNSIDLQRSQEKISLQKNTASGEIRSLNIFNDGAIEVKIMAIYKVADQVTTFLRGSKHGPHNFPTLPNHNSTRSNQLLLSSKMDKNHQKMT